MRRKFSKKQIVIGGAAALAIAVGGGAAYAYWSSSGTGGGTATTGSSTDFVVTVDSVSLADLTPGSGTYTITFHVNNPASGPEKLASAVASVTGTHDGSGPVLGCSSSDFTVSSTTITLGEIAGGATVDG